MAIGKPPVKKKWYEIFSPLFNKVIGETYAGPGPEAAIGRNAIVNAGWLLGLPARQLCWLMFKIVKAEGDRLLAVLSGCEITHEAQARLVRKGRTKIDMSLTFAAKDGSIVIKPMLQTKTSASRSKGAAVQAAAKQALEEYCSGRERERILEAIATGALQRRLKERLSKVFPIALCEIRLAK